MAKTSPSKLSNESIRLITVLEEEFAYNHPASNSGVTQGETFHIFKPKELLARIATEIENRNKWEGVSSLRSSTVQHKLLRSRSSDEMIYQTSYTRLSEWINENHSSSEGVTTKEEITKESIEIALTEKAADSQLLEKEIWLLDEASRSYTLSLVQQYRESLSNPTTVSVDRLKLNKLLLEDAFAEYVLPEDSTELSNLFGNLLSKYQCALCLSGGGIRSATYALGIIQGLAQHDLLHKFTYLSTVSGGGYIGSWLSAWIHHEGMDNVLSKLKTTCDTPIDSEPDPVQHLRQFSNYLSPQLGLFSADSWTLAATYLRNLLLIWLVILPFLAAWVSIPWVILTLGTLNINSIGPASYWLLGLLLIVSFGLLVYAAQFVHKYVPASATQFTEQPKVDEIPTAITRNQSAFLFNCLLPLIAAVVMLQLVWLWFSHLDSTGDAWINEQQKTLQLRKSDGLTIGSSGGWIFMAFFGAAHLCGWALAIPTKKSVWLQLKMIVGITLAGGFAGFLMLLSIKLILLNVIGEQQNAVQTVLIVPCFLLAILLAGYAFEGLSSRYNDDARREWTARYSAWVLLTGAGWLLITSLVIYGPVLIDVLQFKLATVGISSSILTALLGWSTKTAGIGEAAGSRQGKGNTPTVIGMISSFALPIAAIVTLVCLLAVLSRLDVAIFAYASTQITNFHNYYSQFRIESYEAIPFYLPLLTGLLFFAVGIVLSRRIDTNRFSLHAMYRARLIRAYLGASRLESERSPDPFTEFDEKDNIPMGALHRYDDQSKNDEAAKSSLRGPFHIINIALNLTNAKNLAWQERKAASFIVSPLHAGAIKTGFRRIWPSNKAGQPVIRSYPWTTDKSDCYGGATGISLGTAMTISGAAASPNMGYHSSPLIAFLMTMFNVRLGWWLGNPGPSGNATFWKSTPDSAIKPILGELFGFTNDTNKYVYLSDGGHFENLGLYEMVLRRNRFIIVSDASCDEKCTFEDLGNAIRKIRVDLGIPIDFSDDFKIRARSDDPAAKAGRYWAIGRIRYSAVDKFVTDPDDKPDDIDGLLLYIKPGFYGNEPRDIFNYASSKNAFPHESTGDQFFSESQFESYRALGKYAIDTIQSTLQQEAGVELKDFFQKEGLINHWLFEADRKKDK